MNEKQGGSPIRFGKLDPSERTLTVIAIAIFVSALSLYAVSIFQSASITNGHVNNEERITWNGGKLLLSGSEDAASRACTVTPKNGRKRQIALPYKPNNTSVEKFFSSDYVTVDPWFTGSAQVTCTGDANAWQGSAAKLQTVVGSGLYKLIAILLTVIPLGSVVVRRAKKQRKQRS